MEASLKQLIAALSVCVVVLALAGCGESSSGEAEAEAVAISFAEAWEEQDGPAACALLSDQADAFFPEEGRFTCDRFIFKSSVFKDPVSGPEVTDSSVDGEAATVEVTFAGRDPLAFTLTRTPAGEWKVDAINES
jgi:hypothetical protein